MKNSTSLFITAFIFFTLTFGILILGCLFDENGIWTTSMFALSFSVGLLAFWGWVAITNKKS